MALRWSDAHGTATNQYEIHELPHKALEITTFGLLLIFNAGCIAILGFFTELGITNETTAKWSEINVTADQADAFGLKFLAVAIAVWVVGFGLTKASGEKA